jgi:ribulose-phosphate 3-epimerase
MAGAQQVHPNTQTLIFPPLLALDFAALGKSLNEIEQAGAKAVHLDVGDGHYCKEVTAGSPVVESLSKHSHLEIDVRLAVERPERYAADFVKAGARCVAVHPDSTNQLYRVLSSIRKNGAEAGVALQPGVPWIVLNDVWQMLDFVTVICSEWDRKQEHFIAGSLQRIEALVPFKSSGARSLRIQAEGGIVFEQIRNLAAIGVDIIVPGPQSRGHLPPGKWVESLIQEAQKAQPGAAAGGGTPLDS